MDGIPLNLTGVRYWQTTGYREADVMRASQDLEEYLFARFTVGPQGKMECAISKLAADKGPGHFPSLINFMNWLSEVLPFKLPAGSFLVLLHDGYLYPMCESMKRVPIFAFARTRQAHQVILMPDVEFIHRNGYAEERNKLREHSARSPWHLKTPTVYWRGGANGVGHLGERWRSAPRSRLCLESKKINNRDLVDAAFTNVPITDARILSEIQAENLCAPAVPFEQFYNYKYLIDVDGEHCTWQSHFMKLASSSTFLKVESDCIQWYHDLLRPWSNYVPLASNLSDLREVVEWLRAHDQECREIALSGMATVSTISVIDATLRFGCDLRAVLQACRN